MKICRYAGADGANWGLIENDIVYALDETPFRKTTIKAGAEIGSLTDVQLLSPVAPGKIVCVGRNYVAHAEELGNDVPDEPLIFLKPPSSIIGPGKNIELLPEMGRVDHEAELVIVISKKARFVIAENAHEYICGYTCANDISERDYQHSDGQWTRAKGFDTFCPVGPWIMTDFDASDRRIQCEVNNQVQQDSRTSLMVFNIPRLIEHISRIMTLHPGDIILTGTPAGVSPIKPGDELTVSIEGIGSLRNTVIAIDA